ncbi:LexA family transcriptional regulator [Acinetobacter defluvii]|uniref:LexA family transcriptional regulator n=1 Tax=Acinetobacter defluvii TaxID=1871111 RepID=A0A2S2FE74_9GAMM|nr:LexA family transcriptional regulator [Acinetobacter defluvii]AWL29254.1 LexA family transcriptional regulator [Acinetobacter defluvii]
MSVGNRIRSLRSSCGLSQPALAKKAKVGQSTISDLENDKKSTSAEKMDAIAAALNTTAKYLLTGKDETFQLNKEQIERIEFNENMSKNLDFHSKKSPFKNILDFNEIDEVEIKYFDQLPISCGNGAIGEIMESDFKVLKTNFQPLKDRGIRPNDCVVFPSIGNSMDPTIKDKYLVYVDLSRNTVKDGKIFAVCHGGLFKFKRLYNLPLGGVRIVSDNSIEYPEERLTAQEIIDQQFEIIGWAWSWQAMENW